MPTVKNKKVLRQLKHVLYNSKPSCVYPTLPLALLVPAQLVAKRLFHSTVFLCFDVLRHAVLVDKTEV